MALVGARVHSNALDSLVYTELGMVNHAGVIALSGISQQGNLVEIDTQSSHCSYQLA